MYEVKKSLETSRFGDAAKCSRNEDVSAIPMGALIIVSNRDNLSLLIAVSEEAMMKKQASEEKLFRTSKNTHSSVIARPNVT
jgi:hypothetical protein